MAGPTLDQADSKSVVIPIALGCPGASSCTPEMTRLLLQFVGKLDTHDPLLAGHGERVSAYADLLGRASASIPVTGRSCGGPHWFTMSGS